MIILDTHALVWAVADSPRIGPDARARIDDERLTGRVGPAIALDSVRLPGEFHADPADRFLIATARHWTAALVTADAAILEYSAAGHVPTIDAAR